MRVFPAIRAATMAFAIVFASSSQADPISDLFRFALGQREAALHPSNTGWRRANQHRNPAGFFHKAEGSSMVASYYGGGPRKYEPNSHTASGDRFNQWGLTAAHRTLPFGTKLLVTHACHSVVVTVNDRGPAAWTGRSLDLSRGAAARIAMLGVGVARINVQVLQ